MVRGVTAPLPPEAKKIFLKFDYDMVHSEVYLNKYVVSIAPFSTPLFRKLLFFARFRFLIFNSLFHSLFSFTFSADPICPYVRTPMRAGSERLHIRLRSVRRAPKKRAVCVWLQAVGSVAVHG